MKIVTWNILNCGTKNLGKEYRARKEFKFGIVLENQKWESNLLIEEINEIKMTITGIMDKILDISPDIIILQEFQYQLKDYVFPYLKQYEYYYDKELEDKIARNGILIATKGEHTVRNSQDKIEKRNWGNINWNGYEILGVDVLVSQRWKGDKDWKKDRTQFWKNLINFKNNHHEKGFIIGDLNTIDSKSDNDKLIDLKNDKYWYDTDGEFNRPTFVNGNRLDYIFCTSDLKDRILRPVRVIPTTFSDHYLVVLDISAEEC
jgi:exonuclease III